jgi:FKBP-type peptidyl-prolyl cis-trans isomerase
MDRGTLIKDLAIISVMIVGGLLTYLAFNGVEPEVSPQEEKGHIVTSTTTEPSMNNIKIEVIQEGTGAPAKNGNTVTVHYRGTLEDGTIFDASDDRGEPFQFVLGAGQVIPGWEIGILDMKVGEKRILTIPPEFAYGEKGIPPVIPPNATLRFEVELLGVE